MLGLAGHDVAAGALQGKVALLPAGSVEYHGAHGPLGTDTFIARELAARAAAGRPRLLVLPEVVYTPCPPETRHAPGTIDVPEPLAGELLAHVLRALFGAGVAGVVAVNAHEGNVAAVHVARDRAVPDFPGAFVELVNWWETLPAGETAVLGGFTDNGGHGHAAALEMSVTEAIAPGSVRPELAEDERLAREIDGGAGARLLALAAERVGARIDELAAGVGRA
jgi:creatinine amidohydrolase/Fe(II)-dependent formamide hydrolase-like protein